MITAQDILQRLTDVFSKDPNSNLGKLMSILAGQLTALQDTQERTRDWRGIDQAAGTTLDRIGENVVQDRGVATDDIYRILIKSKIARNLSTGDVNKIITVLSTALNCDPSEIQITEMFDDPDEPEPAAIKLIQLPLDRINAIGMSPRQFARIVQRTVAAGVRVGVIELTGTFQYGDLPLSNSSTTGFGDVNDPSVGGTLGAAFDPNDDTDLPL